MTDEEKRVLEKAFTFSMGLRGRYIIAQALHHALKLMEHVPPPHTEVSDISDMEYLRDTLYDSFPPTLFEDSSTSKHWQFIMDSSSSDSCTHVVNDCDVDLTCECGGVFVQ